MQIGDLAAKAGVTPRTIRYYEELGIVEPEERTGGGFRLYSESQLRRLQIVQSLKDLGFDLQRIRQFFNLKNCSESSGGVASALVDHLVEQERQIDERIRRRCRQIANVGNCSKSRCAPAAKPVSTVVATGDRANRCGTRRFAWQTRRAKYRPYKLVHWQIRKT